MATRPGVSTQGHWLFVVDISEVVRHCILGRCLHVGGVSPDGFAYVLSEGHVVDQWVFYVRVVSSDQFIVAHVKGVSLSEDSVFRAYFFGDFLFWEMLWSSIGLSVCKEGSVLIYSGSKWSIFANYLGSSSNVVELSRLFEIAVLILSVRNSLLEDFACISI